MGERVDASKQRRGDQKGREGQGRRAKVDRPTRQCADCSEREGRERETAGFETDEKRERKGET